MRSAYTLIELVIILIILSLLVAISLGFFFKVIERARVKEAISNLKLIQAAEHVKYLEFYQFYPCSTPVTEDPEYEESAVDCTSELDLAESLPTTNWNYMVTVVSDDPETEENELSFTATATRIGGAWQGCQYTLTDKVGQRNEPAPKPKEGEDVHGCVLP